MSPLLSWALALCLWVGVGVGVAGLLRRGGEPMATVLAAVPAWPLFLSLLYQEKGLVPPSPYKDRIQRAFQGLELALAQVQEQVPDLAVLKQTLYNADVRLQRVEAMIAAERVEGGEALLQPLLQAQAHARHEIEAVLAELARIRIQVGLLSLNNNTAPIRQALVALAARVQALEELQ